MIRKNMIFLVTVLILAVLAGCTQVQGLPNTGGSGAAPAINGTPVSLPPLVTAALQKFISEKVNVDSQQVKVISAQKVQWPDSCLGIQHPGAACSQVVTPGFQVVVSANGQQYEVRANEDASVVDLVGPGITPNP